MRELKRSLGTPELRVRLWTLKDKKSMFRASYPDTHIVELIARDEGGDDRPCREVIVMTKEYEDYSLAKSHYENFLRAFGLPLQRKQRP